MVDIDPEIERQLAALDPADWDALCARVRPPEQHPDAKVRAAAAIRAHRAAATVTMVAEPRPLDSSGRGRLTVGAAPSDRGNAIAALRASGVAYDNSDD